MEESFLNKYLAQNLRILLLVAVTIVIIIPISYHYADTGLDIVSIDKLDKGNYDFKSTNVIISGKLLFSKSLTKYKDNKIHKVICPMVNPSAKNQTQINCFFVWEDQYEKDTTYRSLFLTCCKSRRDTVVAIKGLARTFLYEPYSDDVENYEKKMFKEDYRLDFDYFPLVILVDSKFSLSGLWIAGMFLLIMGIYLIYNYRKLKENPTLKINPIEHVL